MLESAVRPTKISVVVVEDHPCLRLGVKSLLAECSNLAVVGEACDGEQALKVIPLLRPHIVVLDLLLPGVDGLRVMESVLAQLPHLRFVAYSGREEAWFVREVLAAGAADYVFKTSPASALVAAVERVALSVAASRYSASGADLHQAGKENEERLRLSRREAETLRLLAFGLPVKEAAATLSIGVRTLETYKYRAMEKLQLRSRVDLIRFAQRIGWLGGDDDAAVARPGLFLAAPPIAGQSDANDAQSERPGRQVRLRAGHADDE